MSKHRQARQHRTSSGLPTRVARGVSAVAIAALLCATVVVQSSDTAHFAGRISLLSQLDGLIGGTEAVAATPSASFVAGAGAPKIIVGASGSVTRSTSAAQVQASAFPGFGMSQGFQPIELSDSALATTFAGIKATGVSTVRLDLPWQQIQPQSSSTYDFGNVKRVYKAAQAQGLKVLPVTSGIPRWAGTTAPKSSHYYYDFLYHAGLTLIPLGIRTIEVWNEANLTGMTPSQYTKLALIPGAKGFRKAGVAKKRTVTVVSTGLAPAATGDGHYSQLDFVKGIYAAGGRQYFDALGDHPYTWPLDPAVDVSWNWLRQATVLRDYMVAKGDSGKQIWATEFGFPTNAGARGVTEGEQADYLVAGAEIWDSYPWAGPLVFYSYQDLASKDTDPEHNFGVVRKDGSAKPGLETITDFVSRH